jgi:glucose-1-phosphate thymidylyltransferase
VEMGLVTGMIEKPSVPSSNLINTGIYAFNKSVFKYLESKLDIPEALAEIQQQEIPIKAIETEQQWLDVVYPWDILDLNSAILRQIPSTHNGTLENGVTLKGQVTIGKGTIVHSNTYISGPVVIGDGCKIGPMPYPPATSI